MDDDPRTTIEKLVDLLFGPDTGEEVEIAVIFPERMLREVEEAPGSIPPSEYEAILLGLEGEEVMRLAVRPEPVNGHPPMYVNVAYTKPHPRWDPRPNASVCFDTITFRRSHPGPCYGEVYYKRTTPPFAEEVQP